MKTTKRKGTPAAAFMASFSSAGRIAPAAAFMASFSSAGRIALPAVPEQRQPKILVVEHWDGQKWIELRLDCNESRTVDELLDIEEGK